MSIHAVAQRPETLWDALVVLTPTDHVVVQCGALEELHVVRQVPGKTAVLADGAVVGDRCDGTDDHTLTLALMCGWGS